MVAKFRHHRAVEHQRAQFAQAEKDLDDLSAAIIAKFGPPAATAKDKSCTYTSNPNEFEKGDLVCNVDRLLSYASTTRETAVEFGENVAQFLKVAPPELSGDELENHPPIDFGFSNLTRIKSELSCYVGYTYYLSSDTKIYHYPRIKEQSALLIDINCGARPAEAAYYPIVN